MISNLTNTKTIKSIQCATN